MSRELINDIAPDDTQKLADLQASLDDMKENWTGYLQDSNGEESLTHSTAE